MPDPAALASIVRRQYPARVTLEQWLLALPGSVRALAAGELNCYAGHRIIGGWRLEVTFSDRIRRLDLLINDRFPREPPRIALIDRPDFLTWPHVEQDGLLCLLPGGAEVDVSRPAEVAANTLAQACQLIEDSVVGLNEDDFRSEFLSYWNRTVDEAISPIYSLLDPVQPTRPVRVWRGRRFYLIGENDPDVIRWLKNYTSSEKEPQRVTEPAVFLWLDRPLLPKQYPRRATDLLAIARAAAPDGASFIEQIITTQPEKVVVILAAPTTNGPCLAGVTISAPREQGSRARRNLSPITRGFRPNKVPPLLFVKRYVGGNPVLRSRVERVDAIWIHGRGQDERTYRLRRATVAILGCGSLGAPVASMLAQAGIGQLVLVDPERLAWANLGRHPLGAAAVGVNKARALADRIVADYPHIGSVKAHGQRWEDVAKTVPGFLSSCDVVVSATGDWAAEGALNEWHLSEGRRRPVVYGWTEPYASAGHAVAIAQSGGCLQCGFSSAGLPELRVTEWAPGSSLRQEPACGVAYQPYGPIELSPIANLIAELALDCLLGAVAESTHRIWAGRRNRVESSGGSWTPEWLTIAGDRLQGGFLEERGWQPFFSCIECQADAA